MSPWISLLLVLALTLVLLCAAAILGMARSLLVPPRMTDGRAVLLLKRLSPGDLELGFSDMTFDIRDESNGRPLRIAGWWIPARHPVDRTVVIVHGYSDAKVGGIAWAPIFHALGWNILAIDLRAHGESGGTYSTAGYWERHDLNQVLDRLKSERARETATLVLFGVSLGAAVVTAAVESRRDIAAVMLEGPYTSYPEAVSAHADLLGAPGGWLRRVTIRTAQWLSNSDFGAVRPVDLIPSIPCPVMIVHARDDFSVTPATAEALGGALARHGDRRDVFWEVADAGHVLCLGCDPAMYQAKVGRFLDSVLREAITPEPEDGGTFAQADRPAVSTDSPGLSYRAVD